MTGWIDAFERLLAAFDRLAIQYMIGGSLASSAMGAWRATQDIDIVAKLTPIDIGPLAKTLGNDYYTDVETMREALDSGRPFNIIHYRSSFKFDIFPLPVDPYYEMEFSRRVHTDIRMDRERVVSFWVATPEDIVLTKLAWYQAGGSVSDRQWADIRGVIAIQRKRLDTAYLSHWACHLNVSTLLNRALQE